MGNKFSIGLLKWLFEDALGGGDEVEAKLTEGGYISECTPRDEAILGDDAWKYLNWVASCKVTAELDPSDRALLSSESAAESESDKITYPYRAYLSAVVPIEAATEILPEALLEECGRLALAVAPELAQFPLYILNRPAGYPPTGETVAFSQTGRIDFAIRDALVAAGKWIGPGAVIVFCDPLERYDALGILLHEVAHVVPARPSQIQDCEPTPLVAELQRRFVADQLAAPICSSPSMPRWYRRHNLQFVRRCCHLHHRAWKLGYPIGLPTMNFAGDEFDLSLAWKYARAFADEVGECQFHTFAGIEARPMPQAATDLFAVDIAAWLQAQESGTVRIPETE